jgi:predicted nuclease with TOPRIM domain
MYMSHTSFEQEVLKVLHELKSDVSELKSDFSELKSDVSELKSDVSELKSDVSNMNMRLSSLENIVLDLRDEVRSESSATRALLGQAFEHISDQIAQDDGKPILSSWVFRARRPNPTAV